MASSGNFSTWTPLLGIKDDGNSGITLSDGNTTATQTHNGIATTGTLAPSSGKFYWEIYYSASSDFSDGHLLAGWQSLKNNVEYAYTKQQPGSGLGAPDRFNWGSHLINYKGGGTSAFGGGYLSSINNVNGTYDGAYNLGLRVGSAKTLQFAGDFDNHKLYFGVDNTWYSLANSGTGSSAANTASGSFDTSYGWSIESTWQGYQWIPACWFSGAASGTVATINAGQDSTFSGRLTAGGNADANGFGDFKYAPPSGFLALCSGNLPISDDIDPAQTDDDYPGKNFNTVIFDGNGGSNAVTGLGFKPDLIWGFTRSGSQSKRVVDSTRGGSERLYSDLDSAASTGTATISEFGTDGFTATGGAFNNDSGKTCGAWCWRANGGTTSTNSDGSTDSTLQANTKAGFSIITYAGNGSNRTIGHGLSSAPDFMIIKNRDASGNWVVYSRVMGAGNRGQLNTTNAWGSSSTSFQSTDPTSSVISLGTSSGTNASGNDFVCYAWHNVEGMQKFGSYEGNANADGPFVYTGFRPRMLFTKRTESTGGWRVRDTARDTFNASTKISWWDSSSIEYSNSAYSIDILSNGFKIRTSSNDFNASEKWIYGAWGDVPFKYNNTF
jgi:hypothetical protein